MTYSIDTQIKYIGIPLVNNGLRDRNRMVVDLNLPMQSVHITTKVVTGQSKMNDNVVRCWCITKDILLQKIQPTTNLN
jgi:hypothetical protein